MEGFKMKKIIVSFLCAIIFMQAGISAYATREDYHTNAEITFFRKGEISDNDFSYFFRLDDKSANSPVYGTLVFIPYYISDENATDRQEFRLHTVMPHWIIINSLLRTIRF
jgi:hypothetical protein